MSMRFEPDREADLVTIRAGSSLLYGNLRIPPDAHGIVLFAHGSGSGRFSPRNRSVAQHLHQAAFGTLLIDLLTVEEEAIDRRTRHLRFDVELLSNRLVPAIEWLRSEVPGRALPIGLFGASTGAAAALIAAAKRPDQVRSVVSRGGRPDLAGPALRHVLAPTLLIVGQLDEDVLELNRRAMEDLQAETRLEIVPRAGHLFEEPGALERVSELAARWFELTLS